MLPFHYTTHRPLRSLPKLLKSYKEHGGSIVEYQRVVSCVFFSRMSSHYVWVPPDGSRVLRSLPDTLTTLLFGWWSLFGFVWTCGALATNLGGGRDATEELLDATRGGNVALAQAAIDEEVKANRQASVRALLQFASIVVGVVLVFWAIAKISDWSMNKVDANRTAGAAPVQARARSSTSAGNAAAGAQQPGQPPRLHAIFYHSDGHSTAIVNRKTVAVGESVGGYKVSMIEPQAVMLRSPDGRVTTLRWGGNGQ
jgi:hypothetical protein